jgi:hypothetical protein
MSLPSLREEHYYKFVDTPKFEIRTYYNLTKMHFATLNMRSLLTKICQTGDLRILKRLIKGGRINLSTDKDELVNVAQSWKHYNVVRYLISTSVTMSDVNYPRILDDISHVKFMWSQLTGKHTEYTHYLIDDCICDDRLSLLKYIVKRVDGDVKCNVEYTDTAIKYYKYDALYILVNAGFVLSNVNYLGLPFFVSKVKTTRFIALYLKKYDFQQTHISNAVLSACSTPNLDVLRYLFDHVDLSFLSENDKMYMLLYGCLSGSLDIIKFLATKEIVPSVKNHDFFCNLCADIRLSVTILEYVLSNVDLDAIVQYKMLDYASHVNIATVNYLIKRYSYSRIDLNKFYLLVCSNRQSDIEIVKLLHQNGVKLQCCDGRGLRMAIKANHIDIVKYILGNIQNIHRPAKLRRSIRYYNMIQTMSDMIYTKLK